MRRERGYAQELPDLAVWTDRSEAPGAVIAESGGRREDRQKMILEGWRDAIWSGRYFVVRYDCPSPSVAHWINRLATKIGLTASNLKAGVQTTAEQIAALPPAAAPPDDEPAPADEPAIDDPTPPDQSTRAPETEVQAAPVQASAPPQSTQIKPPLPQPPEPETAEAAAERERRYREIFGIDEPKPRRRWRR